MSKTAGESEIAEICSNLTAAGYSIKFRAFSAIDLYLRFSGMPFQRIETSADIAVLARYIENLRFPGVEVADGAADTLDGAFYFRCLDPNDPDHHVRQQSSFPLLSLAYDWQSRRFQDPLGVYPMLRTLWEKKEYFPDDAWIGGPLFKTRDRRWRVIMDAALLLARYGKNAVPEGFNGVSEASQADPGPETQRAFLICLLVSPRPELGLKLLKGSGFLDEFWPELARFDDVDQSKEFHPEGNVWNHTLETFRYRKELSSGAYDLRLSLGLLLHDIGKPISASFGSRRFDGHAELGAKAAARFLERLEFEPSIIEDIFFLVKNHMLPAALKRLPLTKTSGIMASPLFPTLMELYRCDESSSFKGLDCYHENSAAYQAYLKNLRNPYRCADGKKMGRREMYSGNLKG